MAPWKGIMALIGGFFLHITLGSGYTAGNMATYIISYLHSLGVDVTNNDSIWIFTMVKFGQGLLMSVGGLLERKVGPRNTTYIGSLIASIGVAVTYYTVNISLTLIVITYGLMFGLGISIAYVSPMTTAMKWFPNHKGLVNGIIVAGFGLGAFIFTQVQTFYLNPQNTKVNKEGYFTDQNLLQRVPNAFLVLGAIYATIQLFSCAALTVPETQTEKEKKISDIELNSVDKDIDIEQRNEQEQNLNEKKEEKNVQSVKRDYTPSEMLKCRQFYILWFTFCFNQPVIVYLPSMYKAYGQTFIFDDKYMAIVGAISAVFNSVGRVMWGWILDKTNYKVCMLIITITTGTLVATLSLTPYGGKVMFTIWIWAIYLAISGNFALMPTCTTNSFGLKNASINYGLVFSNTLVSAPLAAILTQFLSPIVGWAGMFGIIAALTFTSTILTLLFKPVQ